MVQHGRFSTGAALVLITDSFSYFVTVGKAPGQSSYDVTEAKTLHDMNPLLDDKCAARQQKRNFRLAVLWGFF